MIEFKIDGIEMVKKTVKLAGDSGRIYLPVRYVGKSVVVVLLDE